jgi:tetratricopeptide (TPR) repeat protein
MRRMDAIGAASLLLLAEQSGPKLRGLDAQPVLRQLEDEDSELQAALAWFVEHRRTDEALRLVTALAPYWMATKRLDVGAKSFDRAFRAPGGNDALRGTAAFHAGLLVFFAGRNKRARALEQEALRLGRQAGDPTLTALALTGLARIALRSDVEEARRLCREALTVGEGTHDTAGRSSALHVLGVAAQMAGDLDEAAAFMRQRLELGRETDNYVAVVSEATNLSMVERQLGHLDDAEGLAKEALELARRRSDQWAVTYAVNALAAVATDRAQNERAATLLGATESLQEAAGADWPPDEKVQYQRILKLLPGAMGREAFVRARAAGRAMTSDAAVRYALGASRP